MSSSTNLSIQGTTANDLHSLIALSKATFFETFVQDNTPENMAYYLEHHFSEQALGAELGDPANTFFIAYCDGLAAGYAKLRRGTAPDELPRAIELQRIYVLADFQHKKVGAALMQHCIDVALSEAYETCWLGVWEYNTKAIAFYERWGFEVFGTHPFVFGDEVQTDLLMKKSL